MAALHCRPHGFKRIAFFLFISTLSMQASAQSYGGGGSSSEGSALQDASADLIGYLNSSGTSTGNPPTSTHTQHTITKTQSLNSTLATISSNSSISEEEMASLVKTLRALHQYNTLLINLENQNAELTAQADELLERIAIWFEKISQSGSITKTQQSTLLTEATAIMDIGNNLFSGTRDTNKTLKSLSSTLNTQLTILEQTNAPLNSVNFSTIQNSLSTLSASQNCYNNSTASGLNALAISGTYYIDKEMAYSSTVSQHIRAIPSFIETPTRPGKSSPTAYLTVLRPSSTLETHITSSPPKFSIHMSPCMSQAASSPYAIHSAFSAPEVLAETAAVTVEKDLSTNTIRISRGTDTFIGGVFNILLLPSYISDGIITKLDGSWLWVEDSIAYLIASQSADWEALATSIRTAGFEPGIRGDGSVTFQVAEGEFFSGVFANNNPGQHDGACGTVTITPPTEGITAAEYAFSVSCSGSAQTQRILPYLYQTDFYTFADASGLTLRTDRNTGIIDVENLGRFKPSFFSHAFTAEDQLYFDANANLGFAFRSSDINDDGKLDVEVLHNTSVQVLYGL
ncbi:MAG: hypothetical protein H7A05_07975 [Pseudomonadales bacterium]|nr:hypothetical protein [Pseudomonadales bacterium]MCP5344543.1 hypothetical protein [Pseudomonadales bacterium]